MISIVPILGNEKLIPEKPHINMCDPPKFHKIMGGYDAEPRNYYSIYHGLLYKWTELLYLTCPHEADLFTLITSQKVTQYL